MYKKTIHRNLQSYFRLAKKNLQLNQQELLPNDEFLEWLSMLLVV